jgi:NAD(P)-dependent dehydrogenase (short-subunit alcohol dehydrogenase family)
MVHTATDSAPAPPARRYGFTSEELAGRSTVYRSDLLEGRSFIVSGGGSGMGRATAFLMARLGARVMVCGRDEGKLLAVAHEVERLVGRRVLHCAVDIRALGQVERALDHAFTEFGTVDGLVNSAGGQFAQNAIDFSSKGWNAVIDTNLNGTWSMIQQAALRWRERAQAACIVNVVAAFERGIPQLAHTAAARAAVTYLSKSVAVEWAPLNIRINCIAPGTIETEGLNQYGPALSGRLGKSNPMRALGDAWDIAQAAVYLCSDAAKFITGEIVHVDGGMQMWGNTFPLGVPEHLKEA